MLKAFQPATRSMVRNPTDFPLKKSSNIWIEDFTHWTSKEQLTNLTPVIKFSDTISCRNNFTKLSSKGIALLSLHSVRIWLIYLKQGKEAELELLSIAPIEPQEIHGNNIIMCKKLKRTSNSNKPSSRMQDRFKKPIRLRSKETILTVRSGRRRRANSETQRRIISSLPNPEVLERIAGQEE